MGDELIPSVFSEHWASLSKHLDDAPRQLLEEHLEKQPTVPTPANSTVVSPRLTEVLVLPASPMDSPTTKEKSGDESTMTRSESEVNQILKECLQSYLDDSDSDATEGVQLVLSVIVHLLPVVHF